ncbi:MAG: bifunctional diaminohydroxyphosphoribosylaminopyrimidine deaminase/5-amino-6-(5-phosphoribosylamino)uracil reductase RibD [Cytophagaceae bacterium]|jgi:diaminohydroxyphosphoribosylaminopyrimidine deaminase/5-amino-6-(5-phosphoribosylamino)uracil reductase|nr:bifunctional diaminohydroxyphosphoribosylaminopyrimidine deaminase/5-amino-6-(5-phosphoribosylamino)uracil reductase RibD [Cytophagaceae bacterium]
MTTVLHEKYMHRCLELARMAEGMTYPNPMVGAVIVHRNKIIGEGYHRKAGEAHAEVIAVESVAKRDVPKLKDSVIYVSLEPCAHYGKTPPCAVRIINEKIPKVVVGCTDTFSEVSGKGIEMLRAAGVDVTVGVLERECRELNSRFFTYHEKHRPYIILKWAETADGFIDIERALDAERHPTWITDDEARRLVHQWRSHEQAILAGSETVRMDNPSLTVRSWSGAHPLRLTIDREGMLPANLSLFDGEAPTLVFTHKPASTRKNVEYILLQKEQHPFNNILETLFHRKVQSLIVEGGAKLLSLFIEMNLWDEARVFVGESRFVNGVKAPALSQQPIAVERIGNSRLYVYKPPPDFPSKGKKQESGSKNNANQQ